MSPKKSKASEVSFAHVHILLKRFPLWSFWICEEMFPRLRGWWWSHVSQKWADRILMMFRTEKKYRNHFRPLFFFSLLVILSIQFLNVLRGPEIEKYRSNYNSSATYGCFQKIGVPQNGWFIMENPIKMGWFGGKTHLFRKPPNILSTFVNLLKTIKQRQGVFWIVTTLIYTTLQGWFFEPKRPAFPLIHESHVSVPAPTYFESLKDVAVQPTVGWTPTSNT